MEDYQRDASFDALIASLDEPWLPGVRVGKSLHTIALQDRTYNTSNDASMNA